MNAHNDVNPPAVEQKLQPVTSQSTTAGAARIKPWSPKKAILACVTWLVAIVIVSVFRPTWISQLSSVTWIGWIYAFTGIGVLLRQVPFGRLIEQQPVDDVVRAMSFVTMMLLWRLSEVFSRISPVRLSWLVFQFAAVWAAAYLIKQQTKWYVATPAPTPSLAAVKQLVVLLALTFTLGLWLTIAETLWHFIWSPSGAGIPAWFISKENAEWVANAWALSLAVLSLRFAPILLLVIDSMGWLFGPLLFVIGVLLFRH